ncbi:HDIG domain-containing protein [Clostridium sp. 'deep sea']|uniref:HD family phosphohydrolase n=1 Tax=Clostridium sp. 'deep sea' TaxID=2779445 RepID=UPI00189691B4|nr:HDIG domain-containing metalloprotein [Clostridium sp. 'deep sea']QOR35593.1 HDIG domain-containing protein [Clostridium sp. 'deep sea']
MTEFIKDVKRIFNKYFLRKPNVQRLLLGFITYVIILSTLILSVVPAEVNINIGQVSSRTIYAPITFEDEIATEKARNQAELRVNDQYVRDRNLEQQVYDNMATIGSLIIENKSLSIKDLRSALIEKLPDDIDSKTDIISDNTLYYIVGLEADYINELNDAAQNVLSEVYKETIITAESGLALIQHNVTQLSYTIPEKIYVESLVKSVFQPSSAYSEAKTAAQKKEARQNVAPVMIHKGDVLVTKDQVITDQIYSYLEKSGLLSNMRRTQMVLGVTIYLLLIFIVVVALLKIFCKSVFNKVISLLMLALIMIVCVLITTVIVPFSPLFVVSVTVGVLITALLDWQAALISVLAYNFIIAPMIIDTSYALIISLITGVTSIVSSYKMSQRADMIKVALYVAAISGSTVVASNLIIGSELSVVANSALLIILSSIAMVIIAIGSLPLLENTFGIISTIRLLELSNPNRPLLRKLLLEAPGTYNHSIVMGNLAEAAAEAVGADPLLARVGAYYHDIGKLKRPGFFVENQLDGNNPHDKYTPSLSALVIMSHVKDGVELAKEEKLPEQVIDMIKQHHGTTLVSYFYHKAVNQNESEDSIREADYKYDGPRPQTKEAGIIMLSDAIEAAVRSLKRRSPAKVEEVVRKIIKSRLQDGELDECDLTMRDLEKLAETYIRVLSGVYHNRIAYPERSIADLERSKKLGRNSNIK